MKTKMVGLKTDARISDSDGISTSRDTIMRIGAEDRGTN